MHTSLRLLEGISLVNRSCNGYTKGLVSYGGNRRIFRPQGDALSSRVSDLSCHTAGSCELLEILGRGSGHC